jgi:hypothetical protein
MKKIIVTTTINPPTQAILKYQAMPDWELIVVGDLKTPLYPLENGLYLSPDQQALEYPELSEAIGWNCIQRRNIGLVKAYESGADIVAVVDDDNIPLDHWGENLLLSKPTPCHFYECGQAAFDVVGATNEFPIWHRGFPLQLVNQRDYTRKTTQTIIPDIQADLWQGDPDTDAICRMLYKPYCQFNDDCFPIAANKPAPFNSQNTFISRQWLKHFFLFPSIGRLDDIWASYYVQALGAKVLFNKASVLHDRNVHDDTQDMVNEFIGYEHSLNVINALAENPNNIREYLPPNTIKAFDIYQACFN